ncbi:MAG: polyhydroxyalkanoate synthesis regulator DNA-binding domain-containing protein [Isosphaeraceae bacterium]
MTEPSTVEIRRYPNRRLYDRSRRQYVTLQDIEELVLAGTDIEVRDSRTGEDLTRQVLTQLMMERHPRKMELFPVEMLHNMLRANDLAVEIWRGYLQQALAAVDAWQKAAAPLSAPLSWMSALFPGFSGAGQTAATPTTESSIPRAADAQLASLADRVSRLETAGGEANVNRPADPSLETIEDRVEALERGNTRKTKSRPRN